MKHQKPLQIIIDSREKNPFVFGVVGSVATRTKTLAEGDYSVKGYERWIRVERKSLPDWHSCLANKAQRLHDQLAGLSLYKFPLLVVEAKISARSFWSYVDTHGKIRITTALLVAWRVPILFADSRKLATYATYHFLKQAKDRIDNFGVEP